METEIQKSPSEEIIENAKVSESAGTTSFMDPQPKLEKKRGRPPKAKVSEKKADDKIGADKAASPGAAPAFDIPTKVLCLLPGRVVSSWGVGYTKNPKAAMTPEELDAFATGLGMVLDKHLPDAMKNYGPEIMFAGALMQYGIRIAAIKKLMIDHENRMKAAQGQKDQTQNHFSDIKTETKNAEMGVHLVEQNETSVIP